MSSVTVELELPQDWKRFQMPALKTRLSSLLDEQDKTGKLRKAERDEAQALTELADFLSLMKLRAERGERNRLLKDWFRLPTVATSLLRNQSDLQIQR